MKCPPLSQEKTSNSQQVCTFCPTDTTSPVYDFSTMACITEAAGCPSGTVLTTLDKLAMYDSKLSKITSVDATTVKVCAPCDKRCATCSPNNPSMCMSCASTLMTTTVTETDAAGNTMTYKKCTKECGSGKYPDGSKMCVNNCLDNCSKCTDGTTCAMCSKGFFLDDSASTHKCIATCPDGYYGNKLTGKCETCQSPCATCMGSSTTCKSCVNTHKLFQAVNKCFTSCPKGTYLNNGECLPCKENVLNCDQTTGDSLPAMSIPCDSSCSTCFWDKAYCIKCATGKKLAPHGRCVDTCPDSTTEETMNGVTVCKECAKG